MACRFMTRLFPGTSAHGEAGFVGVVEDLTSLRGPHGMAPFPVSVRERCYPPILSCSFSHLQVIPNGI